ncbi:hypothetical protein [Chloroherpeton thalassium]|nr:hypothetical protein [Chloroherpeton thalassium]
MVTIIIMDTVVAGMVMDIGIEETTCHAEPLLGEASIHPVTLDSSDENPQNDSAALKI